ncbi:hypothetical protein C4568_03595 [Candidatus Parcubacteria bacterium]|nr:MAG: hypothetical protein C4568_03595 [Candidatus Parcubacteria bacterium]
MTSWITCGSGELEKVELAADAEFTALLDRLALGLALTTRTVAAHEVSVGRAAAEVAAEDNSFH